MESERPPTVLLTGASSGIGLEIVRLLAARGCEVWGTSRDAAKLPQLPHFHPLRMDLADDASIRESFAQAQRAAGGFDVLINNAGSAVFGPTALMPVEMMREQFQLLLHGPMELVRLSLPAMRQRGCGLIVNITSLAGTFPIPYMAAYSAAKGALSACSQCLRLELAGTPVRVVDVQPADINTAFHTATRRVAADTDRTRQEAVWEIQRRNMAAAAVRGRSSLACHQRSESAAGGYGGQLLSSETWPVRGAISTGGMAGLVLATILPDLR